MTLCAHLTTPLIGGNTVDLIDQNNPTQTLAPWEPCTRVHEPYLTSPFPRTQPITRLLLLRENFDDINAIQGISLMTFVICSVDRDVVVLRGSPGRHPEASCPAAQTMLQFIGLAPCFALLLMIIIF